MRVLVLVLSCKKPPYDKLYEAQKRTWDSIAVEGVTTAYYWCDSISEMPWKLRLALDAVSREEWDYIFRTNSSSYVDKVALLKFAETLPREKCYCGIDGDGFASGSGMFLSRDCVDLLRIQLSNDRSDFIEDEIIGNILREHDIAVTPGAQRSDYWLMHFLSGFPGAKGDYTTLTKDAYHVRCKSNHYDRGQDVVAFEDVHRIKTGEQK